MCDWPLYAIVFFIYDNMNSSIDESVPPDCGISVPLQEELVCQKCFMAGENRKHGG